MSVWFSLEEILTSLGLPLTKGGRTALLSKMLAKEGFQLKKKEKNQKRLTHVLVDDLDRVMALAQSLLSNPNGKPKQPASPAQGTRRQEPAQDPVSRFMAAVYELVGDMESLAGRLDEAMKETIRLRNRLEHSEELRKKAEEENGYLQSQVEHLQRLTTPSLSDRARDVLSRCNYNPLVVHGD